ncbi:MAG: hypothetical protein M3469_06745, partial [Actinomycetota bacterium]|nr:hypothetical protein [Actinomycetota bacterium]
ELLEKVAGGDWEDSTQSEMDSAVKEYADDFGHDLDEEGQPLDEGSDSDRVAGGGGDGASDSSSEGDGDDASDDGEKSDASAEQEAAPA